MYCQTDTDYYLALYSDIDLCSWSDDDYYGRLGLFVCVVLVLVLWCLVVLFWFLFAVWVLFLFVFLRIVSIPPSSYVDIGAIRVPQTLTKRRLILQTGLDLVCGPGGEICAFYQIVVAPLLTM